MAFLTILFQLGLRNKADIEENFRLTSTGGKAGGKKKFRAWAHKVSGNYEMLSTANFMFIKKNIQTFL